jgi:hypothetical protein
MPRSIVRIREMRRLAIMICILEEKACLPSPLLRAGEGSGVRAIKKPAVVGFDGGSGFSDLDRV